MNRKSLSAFIPALLISTCVERVNASYVPGVVVSSYSSEFIMDSRRATNLVNEVGMYGDAIVSQPGGTMWLSSTAAGSQPGTNFVTFDLGSVRPIQTMKVWNYNEQVSGVNVLVRRGVARADILTAGEDLMFTTNFLDIAFTVAPGIFTNFGQVIDFGGLSARYVRINVHTNHGTLGTDVSVGLSKVRFVDTNVPPRLEVATSNFSSNKVTLFFSEAVTLATATNLANYAIQTDGTNSAVILSAAMDVFNNRVMLQTTTLSNSVYTLVASGVAAASDSRTITNGTTVGIEPEVVLWLKADAGVTADGGGLVSHWTDQSRAGNHAAQATAEFQPTHVAGVINGQPVLHFNGSTGFTNYLSIPHSDTLRVRGGDFAIFTVMKFDSFNAFNTIISKTHTNTQPAPFDGYVRANPAGQVTFLRGNGFANNGVNGFTNIVAGQPCLLSFVVRGTNGLEYLNGAFNNSVVTGLGFNDVNSPVTIGARPVPNFGTKLNGDVAEMILIRGDVMDAERLAIHDYLGTKYGLTIVNLVFNEHPANVSKLEGQTATFSVNASASSPNITYQWQRYGTNLPNATNVTYTTPILTQADNNSTFRVRVSIPGSSQFSDSATLTVLPDTELPTVISAGRKIWSPADLVVVFSEAMAAALATNAASYVLDNGGSVTAAAFGDTPNQVVLSTSGLTNGGVYQVTVQNVKDLFNNTLVTVQVAVGHYPAPALWLRADAGVATNETGQVSQWDDQSGNANNAAPIFGLMEFAPTFLADGINGHPSVRFNGDLTNNVFAQPSPSLAINGDISVFTVLKLTNYTYFNGILGKTTINQPASYDFYLLQGSGVPRLFRGSGIAGSQQVTGITAPSLGSPHLISVVMAGTTVSHFLDGQTNGAGSLIATTGDNNDMVGIGARSDVLSGNGPRLNGDIGELLVFASAVSTADRVGLDNYLAARYGFVLGPLPRISIVPQISGQALLSWPTPNSNFVLETSPSLTSTVWTEVTNSVTASGGTNSVSVSAGGDQQFYRLRKQ